MLDKMVSLARYSWGKKNNIGLRASFTPNGRRECLSRDQVSFLFSFYSLLLQGLACVAGGIVYTKISSCMPVLTIGIVRPRFLSAYFLF